MLEPRTERAEESKVKTSYSTALSLLLIGCANPQPFDVSEIDGKTFTFTPHIVDSLPKNYSGLHSYDKTTDIHHIWLIRDEFPRCLEHEILHVLFNNWHKGRNTTEYCYGR